MHHDISEQEWLDYVSGVLAPARAAFIRSHAATCVKCARTLGSFAEWHDLMMQEGSRLRSALELPSDEMESFIADSVEAICAGERPGSRSWSWSVAEGLFFMRVLMEPICGAGTARASIKLAVERSTTRSEGGLCRRNWQLFVANLSEVVASICGLAAGSLVKHAGASLAIAGA
ncbi:MAG: hypothetical protein ABSH49_26785 [Bryobacteraceae bacterium]|jgi:anti-sigma factor RsiW